MSLTPHETELIRTTADVIAEEIDRRYERVFQDWRAMNDRYFALARAVCRDVEAGHTGAAWDELQAQFDKVDA